MLLLPHMMYACCRLQKYAELNTMVMRSRFRSESTVLASKIALFMKERWQVCEAVTLALAGKVQVLR